MSRRLLAALVVLGVALAGCTQGSTKEPAGTVEPAGDAPESEAPAPTPPPNGTSPSASSPSQEQGGSPPSTGPGAPSNATPEETAEPPPREWASPESATVRPGVRVFAAGSQCTSNFVYTSPDGSVVYLGTAAHCFGPGAKIGDPVEIGGSASGTLAYSSWLTMGSDGGDPSTGANPECSLESDRTVCEDNDFALVRVDPRHHGEVSPAMLHFGGPTALASSGEIGTGDKVLTYGNSGTRGGVDATNRREGYVLTQNGWSTTVYTLTPGVPGDSGSGVLTGDGRALGVLVTVHLTPTTGANGVTSLDLALAYAKEKAGVDARLATWELLDEGLLPGV